ncbi:hypothetical protein KAS31_04830 [Candidatus Parcubacteria bacterium]|nr:hypothetical protein [Candidatus Parcubacteria bacterium]MCK5157645.1 hypothetical protein [Candidatus Heimdallarchaeota archaeon]
MNIINTIIAVAIALIIGFLLGANYQNIDSPNEDVQRINAMYSIAYVSDMEGESIGVNIISIDDPSKHFENSVLLNKYDILEYLDNKNDRMLTFAFKGYDSEGKPIIEIMKGLQEELDYRGEIWNLTGGYYPAKIIRSS